MRRGHIVYRAGIFHIDHRADILFNLRRKGEVVCDDGDDGEHHGRLAPGEKCHLCGAVT